MNICIATDSYPPHNSGIATHNYYLARLLEESGNKVLVLTADFEHPRQPDTVVETGNITVVTLRKSYSDQQKYFSRFIYTGNHEATVWLSLGMAMRNWLLTNHKLYNIDIIECSDYGGFGIFLVDEKLPPFVVMCHGMLTQMNKFEFHNKDENLALIRFMETNMIKHADAVICHSPSNVSDILKDFGKQAMYATAAWVPELESSNQNTENEFIIASRLTVHKGALVMAEVMQSLQQDHPSIKVTWFGSDSYTAPEGWKVSKYIRKNFPDIWQKSFTWKKALPRKEMMAMLDQANAVVIPSTWETFNYVALEAANLKKPLIVTKQTGISSLLNDGEHILLTDANDINSIKTAMLRIVEEKGLDTKLGNNLFHSAINVFSSKNILDDRLKAWSLAIEYRKTQIPSSPLQAFFIT